MLGVEHLLPPAQLIMRKLAQGIRQRAPSDAKGAGSLVHGKRPHGPRGPCEVSLTDAGGGWHQGASCAGSVGLGRNSPVQCDSAPIFRR
jgi:hypothetical protein